MLAILGLLGLALLASLLGRNRKQYPRLTYGLALLLVLCAGLTMSACGSVGSGSGNSSSGSSESPVSAQSTYNLVVSGTFTSGSTKLTQITII